MSRKFDLSKLNSRQVAEDAHYERRALFKAMHFDDEDLRRPFIAVANSWSEFVPGHYHLRSISEAVKAGIWEAVSPHIFLDWFRFKTETIRDWVNHLAKTVRKIDPKHKLGTNGFIGICTRVPDHSLIAEKLDWYGLDIYPKGGRRGKRDLAFILDLWRSFTRGTKAEFHITELQGGQNVRWGAPEYVKGPEIKTWTELVDYFSVGV